MRGGFVSAPYQDIISYVEQNTGPDDNVLVWGGESQVNFFTQRAAPTRFVYQFPLYERNYVTATIVEEFLNDLLINPPEYIFDSYNWRSPLDKFDPLSPTNQSMWQDFKNMYTLEGHINTWDIYKLNTADE